MAAYVPPEWGVDGANAFGIYLEVIKSGVVVENMALPMDPKKSCVVAGRMEPLCDLVLAHPSISRVHAALQFDAQGALFLRDLESTHGTFLNKKRLPADDFVRLHIGDVLVFGESTRVYAVCGPPELLPQEYDSLNLQTFREKSEKRQEKKATQRKDSRRRIGTGGGDDDGASWGFGEDAAEVDDDDEDDEGSDRDETEGGKEKLPDYLRNLKEDETPYKSSLQQSEVSEKDQKLFAQLQTRIKKMENLKLEKSRIQAKQNQLTGGLSEGQEKTLERNEQRIEALKKEIEGLEERIHAKNAQREKTKSASAAAAAGAGTLARKKQNVNEALYGYESDEDDFYDRTSSNQRKHQERKQQLGVAGGTTVTPSTAAVAAAAGGVAKPGKNASEVLTAESIQAKIKSLESELSEITREYADAQALASRDVGVQEQKQDAEPEEADSLDSFMASTTRELHSTQLSSLETRKRDLETELRRQRQLLVVATPALAAVPAATRTEVAEPSSSERGVMPQPPSISNSSQQQGQGDKKTKKDSNEPQVPRKPTGSTTTVKRPAEPREEDKSGEMERSGVKEQQPKPHVRSSSSNAAPTTAKSQANVELTGLAKKRRVVGPARPPPTTAVKSSSTGGSVGEASTLEGGDSVWVPPTNQTGDGRTKLNDKYGY